MVLLGEMGRLSELERRNWKNGAVAVFDAILNCLLPGSVYLTAGKAAGLNGGADDML